MKIIVFVGSPIQDGERDVSNGHVIIFTLSSTHLTIDHTLLDDKTGQEIKERESDC